MYGSGLEKLQYRCVPEINQMVNRIRKFEGDKFDPWDIFYDSACNIMLDLVRIKFVQTEYLGSKHSKQVSFVCIPVGHSNSTYEDKKSFDAAFNI